MKGMLNLGLPHQHISKKLLKSSVTFSSSQQSLFWWEKCTLELILSYDQDGENTSMKTGSSIKIW